jgi:hypothetical protein
VFSWSAPLIDLVVHRGMPARMNYISINSWTEFFQAYLTFGGPGLMRGATLGIRIEIACLVIACFLYVLGKRHSILRAALAALAIYSMLFATGAIPYLLGLLVRALGLQYTSDDQSTVLLLYCLNAGLLSYALLRHAPELWREFRTAVPWSALCMALVAFGTGAVLAHRAYPDNVALTPTTMFWIPMLPWLALAFSLWLGLTRNDLATTVPLRIAIWIVVSAGSMLMDVHFAFALQLLFALCWLWLGWLAPWRGRVVAALGFAAVLPASALAGFQLMGAPMIGFPGPWLLAISVFGAAAGTLSTFVAVALPSNTLTSVSGEK